MKTPNLPSTQLSLLPQYAQARQMLERATRFEDVLGIRDKAEALRAYAAAIKDRAMETQLGELKLHAQRRAGRMLLDGRQNGHVRKQGNISNLSPGKVSNFYAKTLADIGITYLESHQWQKIAFLSDDAFEQRLAALRDSGIRATTKSFLEAEASDAKEPGTPKEILRAVGHVLGEFDDRTFIAPPRGLLGARINDLVQAFACGAVTEAIALVEARTDTAWFDLFVDPVVCFLSGAKFPQLKPSAAVYLGNKKRAVFARRFARLGSIWTRIPIANPEKD